MLLDLLDLGVLLLDAQGRIQHCNRWLLARAGLAQAPLGQSLAQVCPDTSPRLLRAVDDALSKGRSTRLSHAFNPSPLPLFERPGGERLRQAVDLLATHHEGQRACLIQVRDVSESTRREGLLRLQAQQLAAQIEEHRQALRATERQAAHLAQLNRLAPVGLFEIGLDGRLLECNERFAALLEKNPRLNSDWVNAFPAPLQEQLDWLWQQGRRQGQAMQQDFALPGHEGRWLRLEALPMHAADGQVFAYLGTLTDVSELQQRAQKYEHRAHHDDLTGLPNRERLMQRLNTAVTAAKTLGGALNLVFMDLDGFKRVNDVHGHAAGDRVLQQVARRMRRSLRGDDVLARLSGDEFAILFADELSRPQVHAVMDKLSRAVAEPLAWGEHSLQVGCSWGLARFSEDGPDAMALLAHADHAMYQHKRSRRSR